MSAFLNPWGLVALLSLPAIVWLHRFVMWARVKEVSCLPLWQDDDSLQHEGQSRDRPPWTWILLLELIAAVLLTLLLAQLNLFNIESGGYRHVGVIIDGSASMAANNGDAVRQASGYLKSVTKGNTLVTVVRSGNHPELVGERLKPEHAVRVVETLSYTDINHTLEPALELISLFTKEPGQVIVLSDNSQWQHPRLKRVGAAAANMGLVNGDWPQDGRPFVVVRKFGQMAGKTRLHVKPDQGQPQYLEIDLSLQESMAVPLKVTAAQKRLDISLPDDAFSRDNHITLLRPQSRVLRLYLDKLDQKNAKAMKAFIRAFPHVAESSREQAHLVVTTSNGSDSRNGVYFHPLTQNSRLAVPLSGNGFHPLMAGFDARGLVWFADDKAAAQGEVLLQAGRTPLIWLAGKNLHVNMDATHSNFFKHETFPVLMHNYVEYIKRQTFTLERRNYRLGEVLSATFGDGKNIQLTGADGEQTTFNGQVHTVLDRAGMHQLDDGERRLSLWVNFFDADESALDKRKQDNNNPVPQDGMRTGYRNNLAKPLITMLLLLAVCAVWWLLNKRGRPL